MKLSLLAMALALLPASAFAQDPLDGRIIMVGASAGPAVKMLSIGGKPHEMSATTRFGGETLFEFNEVSPFRDRRLWHSARVSGRDRFNKLDQLKSVAQRNRVR
jgi:hypothetical protein